MVVYFTLDHWVCNRGIQELQRRSKKSLRRDARLDQKRASQESHPELSEIVAGQDILLVVTNRRTELIFTGPGTNEHRGLEQTSTIRQHEIVQNRHLERLVSRFST